VGAVQAALDMAGAARIGIGHRASTTGVRNPYAVLAARLSPAELPELST